MSTNISATDSRYSAPALEKGLDVLDLLAAEPGINIPLAPDENAHEIDGGAPSNH